MKPRVIENGVIKIGSNPEKNVVRHPALHLHYGRGNRVPANTRMRQYALQPSRVNETAARAELINPYPTNVENRVSS